MQLLSVKWKTDRQLKQGALVLMNGELGARAYARGIAKIVPLLQLGDSDLMAAGNIPKGISRFYLIGYTPVGRSLGRFLNVFLINAFT